MARQIGDPETIAHCLGNVAYSARDNKNLQTAQENNREGMRLERTLPNRSNKLESRYTEGTIEDGLKHYQAAEEAFREVVGSSEAGPSLALASTLLAGWNSTSNRARAKKPARTTSDAVKTFDDARKQQGRDEFKIAFRAGVNRYYSPYVRFLMNQGDHFDARSVAEQSRAQVLAERLGVDAGARPNLPKIQATAAALHATILSYWLAPQASYLWVVTAKEFTAVTLPQASEISQLVERYRQNIAATSHTPDTRLYEALIAPAHRKVHSARREAGSF